jgi:hypothetical protein
MMFNNGLPYLSLFCCISLLCLPHCLSTHITCAVCSSTFYVLCSMSIHCTVPLLCYSATALSSFFTHESPSPTTTTTTTNNNNNLISSLYHVYIAFVHLMHAIFSIPMHAHTAPISSISRVLYVIIIVTLQLLWPFSHAFSITGCYVEIPQPLWKLGLFVFSVTVELTFSVLVTGFYAHPSVNPF